MPGKQLSVDEAKIKFIASMEPLSVTKAVRRHPLKSVAIAAAAGAAARVSCGGDARLFFPALEFAGIALRLILKR